MRYIIAAALLVVAAIVSEPSLPSCPEDAVLIGSGSFEHGRWSAYGCGPAVDDYR